ncbi:MAG: aspartate/glutamate racemase family protein [Clostridia bacterium]|nr:aspartate/glutamate racemase family protein [Clostridia bacterium]
MKKYILVIDSGVGGLTTLFKLKEKLPNNYIYFADYKNHPYGTMEPNKLCSNLVNWIAYFSHNFDLAGVILACNTATVVCIEKLRKNFPDLKIVGTKPSIVEALKSGCKRILVLSTPNTAKYCTIPSVLEGAEVIFQPFSTLASLVEDNLNNLSFAHTFLSNNLAQYKSWVDGVILGCTHYIYLKCILKNIFDKNVKIFNSGSSTLKLCAKLFKKQFKSEIKMFSNSDEGIAHVIIAWQLLKEGLCAE